MNTLKSANKFYIKITFVCFTVFILNFMSLQSPEPFIFSSIHVHYTVDLDAKHWTE